MPRILLLSYGADFVLVLDLRRRAAHRVRDGVERACDVLEIVRHLGQVGQLALLPVGLAGLLP